MCDVVGNLVLNIIYFVFGENVLVVYSKIFVIKSFSVIYVKMYICMVFNGV